MKHFTLVIFVLSLILWADFAYANYIRTGPVIGPETTFIGVGRKGSGTHSVDAIEGEDGKLYRIQQRFSEVDEYRNGRCWVHLKSKGFLGVPNIFSGISNLFNASYFSRQPDGSFEEIDIDSLIFNCRRTN
jgi:hypothetical protein